MWGSDSEAKKDSVTPAPITTDSSVSNHYDSSVPESPPAPPPAHADYSSDFSSHYDSNMWGSESEAKKDPATPAPITTESSYQDSSTGASESEPKKESATPVSITAESSLSNPFTSDYEKTLFGNSQSVTYSSESSRESNAPQATIKTSGDDVKPMSHLWDKDPSPSYRSPFDDAQKLIDAAPAVQSATPSAQSTPVTDNSWGSAFSEPSSATPVKTVAKISGETSSYDAANFWMSTFDAPAVDTVAKSSFDSSPRASSSDVAPTAAEQRKKSKTDEDDPVTRMRRLLRDNSLLQKNKKGHMISIKLHRTK
jgi:hypothetical protein